ncbi:MAG: hypothetical protein ACREP8_16550 [Candidatus Binatia bacterium]
MTLLTAHRILISTAVVFFLGFALWELNHYLGNDDPWAVMRGLLYLLASVGFGLYLKFMKFRLK